MKFTFIFWIGEFLPISLTNFSAIEMEMIEIESDSADRRYLEDLFKARYLK